VWNIYKKHIIYNFDFFMLAGNSNIALAQVSAWGAFVNILIIFLLVFGITYIYRLTHRGFSYSQSFVFSLMLVAILSGVVMMIVENSLARAFAILGTFTIIRYRTAIKDTRDTAFLLWAIVTGLAVGTLNYAIAIVSTLFVGLIVYVLYRLDFGSSSRGDHILRLTINGEHSLFDKIFSKYLASFSFIRAQTTSAENDREIVYSVVLLKSVNIEDFITTLEKQKGIKEVELIASSTDAEY
jgi:hypothetical protein